MRALTGALSALLLLTCLTAASASDHGEPRLSDVTSLVLDSSPLADGLVESERSHWTPAGPSVSRASLRDPAFLFFPHRPSQEPVLVGARIRRALLRIYRL